MPRRWQLLRFSLALVVSLAMLAVATFGASAQDEILSATGSFEAEQRNPGGYELTMSGRIELTFHRSGGSAIGMIAAENVLSHDGIVLEHFLNIALNGTFEGFPSGNIGGSMSGLFTDKHVADQLFELQLLICAFDIGGSDPDCIDPAPDYDSHTLEVSGSWEGRLDRGSFGSGTLEINIPAYSVGRNSFQAMDIRGTWEISDITVGDGPPLAQPLIEEFIPGAVPLLNMPTLPTSQIPAFVVIGVIGALAGLWLSQNLAEETALRSTTTPRRVAAALKLSKSGVERVWGDRGKAPPPGQARSPVDGRLVPIEQAHHEEALLNTGYKYDARNDTFFYDSEKAEALRADPASPMSEALKDEIKRAEAIRAERIHELTAWQEQNYRAYMAEIERYQNAIMALNTTEFLVNAGISTAAHYIPTAGPIIETAVNEIKAIAATESTAYDEESMVRLREISKKPFYKAFRDRFKIQVDNSSQKVLVVMLDQVHDKDREVAVTVSFDAIMDSGTQLITGNP
jgi:hypothetical protein